MLKRYPLHDLIAGSGAAFGTMLSIGSPELMELAGLMGFDFAVIDGEHGPVQPDGAVGMLRAAEAVGMAALVRVSSQEPQEALRYLDAGAVGILFPHVGSRAEAEQVAGAVRYPPRGARGIATTTRAAAYGGAGPMAEYLARANRDLLVIPIIETAAGVADIEDLLTVEGIDAVAIGAVDLSVSLGHGGAQTPEVERAFRRVVEAATAAGRPVLAAGATVAQLRAGGALGARLLMVPFASWLLQQGRAFLQEARAIRT